MKQLLEANQSEPKKLELAKALPLVKGTAEAAEFLYVVIKLLS